MKRLLLLPVLVFLAGCADTTLPVGVEPAASLEASAVKQRPTRPFKFSKTDFAVHWTVDRSQELACGGLEIAGGSLGGSANITHLGRAHLIVSAAWNIGDVLDPADVQFEPVGPAGGPVAPILGPEDYPYAFHFDPYSRTCGNVVTATGAVRITAANGDEVFGQVQGGETHRLDFVAPGDGVESFTIVEIAGGTGRFQYATGTFVAHVILRFNFETFGFDVLLAETMPGATIAY